MTESFFSAIKWNVQATMRGVNLFKLSKLKNSALFFNDSLFQPSLSLGIKRDQRKFHRFRLDL